MKNLFFLTLIVFSNCSNNSKINDKVEKGTTASNDSIVYANKEYKMVLFLQQKKVGKFQLYNLKSNTSIIGKPELIKIDGEIPEGTNRIDYNNPNDIRGYEADSTYQFLSKKIEIAFATEKITKKRLDLSIYGSTNKDFIDGDYTLLNQGSHK